jgi:hypothetical protein
MHVTTRAFLVQPGIEVSLIPVPVVNAYPGDPQARKGLTTCMDVLQRMSVAWPSAGRAWELLHGNKANLLSSVDSLSTTDVVRIQKRTLDHFLNEEAAVYQVEPQPTTQEERSEAVHSQSQRQQESPLVGFQNFYPIYDRWSGEDSLNGFTSLSTSVLPQQYSTGFFDRVVVRDPNISTPGAVDVGPQQDLTVRRRGYPRYWNDFSALSQLGAPFSNSIDHVTQQHQQTHSQMYPISGQYSLYGEQHLNHLSLRRFVQLK